MAEPRITNVALDEDGLPAEFTVILPAAHAYEIAKWTGGLSPSTTGTQQTSELWDCLSSMFNRFYEDGVDGYGHA